MTDPRRRQRQLALFMGSLVLLNFPVLAVVDQLRLPGGMPLTPIYLFVVWIGMIVCSALCMVRLRG